MSVYSYYQNPGYSWSGAQPAYLYPQQNYISAAPAPNYMIQVDGEIGAKAWQPQTPLAPNTVIPLWDFDGIHVYFKSTDNYGRMNPMRVGRVVFDEVPQPLPQGTSGAGAEPVTPQSVQQQEMKHTADYVTRDDFESLKDEIRQMLREQPSQNRNSSASNNNQNGRGNRG